MRESKAMGRTKNLKVYGPKSVLDKLVSVNTLLGGAKDECDRDLLQKNIDFIDVGDGDEFELAGYKVKVYKMDHGHMYCQGYTFEDSKGNIVGFSADTKECDGLLKILKTDSTLK
jgi:ribonuclease BN (tRNA processing enzyme)